MALRLKLLFALTALCLFALSSSSQQQGQSDQGSKNPLRANLGAKFRRGIFFNGTFNPRVKSTTGPGFYYEADVNEPDGVIHIQTVLSADQLRTVDLTPKNYLVVPFAKVYHLTRNLYKLDPNLPNLTTDRQAVFQFVTKSNWTIKQVQG